MAAYLVLSRRSYFSILFNVDNIDQADSILLYLVYLGFSLLVIVALALSKAIFSFRYNKAIAASPFILCIVGVLVLGFLAVYEEAPLPLLIAGVCVFAVGSVCMAYAWAVELIALGISSKGIAYLVTLAFLFSALLSLTTAAIPDGFERVYVLACPLVTFASWLFVSRNVKTKEQTNGKSDTFGNSEVIFFSLQFIVCSVILGNNFSVSLSNSIEPVFLGTHLALIVVCAAMLGAIAYVSRKKEMTAVMECIAVLLFVALFFFEAMKGNEWVERSCNVVACTRLCFELMMWIAFLSIVTSRGVSLRLTISILLALRIVSEGLINTVVPNLIELFGMQFAEIIYRASLALFFLASLVFLIVKLIEFMKKRSPGVINENYDADHFARYCETITNEYGLSDRESEILGFIARGYSSRWIADTLFISISTVQSHTKRIYRKLNIHSKQSLIELVNKQQNNDVFE